MRDALGAAAGQHERGAGCTALLGSQPGRRSEARDGGQREREAKTAEHRAEDTTTPCATPRTFVYLTRCAPGPARATASDTPEEPQQ